MKKSKLFDIFYSITKAEWKPLLDFIASPYFNKDTELVRLGQQLHTIWKKDFPDEATLPAQLWQALYPDRRYDAKAMSYLMSNMVAVVERFLGQRQWEDEPLAQETHRLQAFAQRKLDKSYRRLRARVANALADIPLRDKTYHRILYAIASADNEAFNQQNIRQRNPHLDEMGRAIDGFFVHSKLPLFCHLLNEQRTLGTPTPMLHWPEAPSASTAMPVDDDVFQVYLHLYTLLTQDRADIRLFETFRTVLPRVRHLLPADDVISLYYMAINFCLVEINKGNREYAHQLLEMYEEGLTQGLLLVQDELSPWMYKNIVKLGLGLQRFDWVEHFLEHYTDKLPVEQRDDARYFNLADLRYHQKAFDAAQHYLNQVEFSDISYKHGAKVMLLKIYFEKQETEAFFSLAASYKLLLLRDRGLSDDIRMANSNFVRLTGKLFRLPPNNPAAAAKLHAEITRTQRINGRNWLLEQMKQML